MAKMYFVTGDEYRAMERRWADVLRRSSGKGTTLSPQLVLDRLQEMSEMPAHELQHSKTRPQRMPELVKGLFSPPEWKIANVVRWNEKRRWGFMEEDFERLPNPPAFPDLPFATVVLVPYLETPQKTYDELDQVIQLEHWKSDSRMRLYDWSKEVVHVCGTTHVPGLRWEVINMDAFRFCDKYGGHSIGDIRPKFDPVLLPPAERLPHAGVLAELAHSPYWARSLCSNGGAAPGIWIPGYTIVDSRLDDGTSHSVGQSEHLIAEAYSSEDPYASHRKGLRIEKVRMQDRVGFELSTPVLMQ